MLDPQNVEWCALNSRLCWTRAEWISLWSSFGGVLIAFLLGVFTQILSKKRESKTARLFLESTLRKSLDAISFFDTDWRRFGTEEQISESFGGLAHAAAAIKWASAHPDKFEPYVFINLLKIEHRVAVAADTGPAKFAGPNFVIAASNYLSGTVPEVAGDIRFLLGFF